MADIKPDHKQWAKHLRDLIPGAVRVTQFADKAEQTFIAIFTSENDDGVVAATVGLMEHDQSRNPDVHVFTEILMDARGRQPMLCNVLSTLAFFIIKDGWKAAPGVVFETLVEPYAPELHVKHVLFTSPFQWPISKVELTDPRGLRGKTIYPLLAVPITDAELAYVNAHGAGALEAVWTRAETDVLDWTRTSAV